MRILADENVHMEIIQQLRHINHEVLSIPDIGMVGHKDSDLLDYSEKHKMTLISGDKDFGGLIEFGTLWGRGKVILLRYRIININRIVNDITEVLIRETEALHNDKPVVIVLSEGGYRIHKPEI